MAKAYDLTNQRFGRLIVLYKDKTQKLNNHYPWICKCDCGKIVTVRTQDLIRGKTTSCGCYKKEIVSQIGKKTGPINGSKNFTLKDITNQNFGNLIALYPTQEKIHNVTKWQCKCICGNYCLVAVNDLLSGNTQSCGCLKSKGQKKIIDILNQYNISFVTEKSFDDFVYSKTKGKPRFDFFVANKYIIEYDGIQHHFKENNFFKISLKEQQLRDKEKNNWCKKHNIPIIRIPYTHLDELNIKDLLLETSEFIIK